ncbi:FAD-binding oxidoreductase [Roseateles sp. DAIF2]|uniref:FAD-binding oxidoreductase n=1 Tax=Roseateles sp. DAIF2 TaxID=2714952 RepID=UPI0018A2D390|nr:FAD-binding oxidoreductase [Roseateles sp. DAIF2]QPF75858.1 FAD-binding oxidoreductase [Roseateles sp. DAIF2]
MSVQAFLAAARAIVGPEFALEGAAIEPRYLEPARYAPGRAAALVRPATTAQVAELVQLVAAHDLTLVPQGAHTGLVRAGTPTDGERHVLLATDRLRERFEFDPLDRTLRVSAGYKLSEINERLEAEGLFFPIDLSADPSVGGMLAHNTGGTRMLRYGDVRANTLALTAVLAGGQVLQAGRGLQKDNTGLALQQLFVGSSGSLGVITEATLKLHPLPRQRAAALVAPAALDAVLPLYQTLMASELAGLVSAFEGISKPALQAALQHVGDAGKLFDGHLPEYALLVELASELPAARLDLNALLQEVLEREFESGRVVDAVIGADEQIWALRHSISEGLRDWGKVIGFDVSLPRRHFMRFRAEGAAWLAEHFPPARLADFGHLGDGGLHFNLAWPHDAPPLDAEAMARLREGINAIVVALGGSFSAEHGVGPQIQAAYWQFSDAATLALAGGIEALMNPKRTLGLTRFGAPDAKT